MLQVENTGDAIRVTFRGLSPKPGLKLFLALSTDHSSGSAVVPFAHGIEGSTVFLPFRANRIYFVGSGGDDPRPHLRRWSETVWGSAAPCEHSFSVDASEAGISVIIPWLALAPAASVRLTGYAKDMHGNSGWGMMLPDPALGSGGGEGDRYVPRYFEVPRAASIESLSPRERLGSARVRVYQLLPRLFGNTNLTRKQNGSMAENGCGKFEDINATALTAIRDLGISHVWLTGIHQQATATDYPSIGAPADDADLLKGLAGSPYAIKDYFDVCPDYARNPANRLAEFRALVDRIRQHGMRCIIDFVPNHVARSYESDIQPDLSFGKHDDRTKFFDPQNNFYYLRAEDHAHGPPLRLPTVCDGNAVSPTCRVTGTCDGLFSGEAEFGRVTGNNVVSWAPSLNDWYETVKLNYGFNFTDGNRQYPHNNSGDFHPIPDTWLKMDRILAHWQDIGVDGFRCDMAHMVPPEFWAWAIGRARARQHDVFFMGEAYNNDPMKVPAGDPLMHALNEQRGNVMFDLLSAGFDAVYDDPSYKKLKSVYDSGGWANDLDTEQPHDFIFHNSLRYAENHDEVRLAGRNHWGSVGMDVGQPVAAILYGMGRGPVMLYHGQEAGEPANGSEGFSDDNARTTIFDYWSMPEFTKWVNDHRYDGGQLSSQQADLREYYRRLLHAVAEPAFAEGEYYPLNGANVHNPHFARAGWEPASGHWIHAFIRTNGTQHILVVTNLRPGESSGEVKVGIPAWLLDKTEIIDSFEYHFSDLLGTIPTVEFSCSGTEIRESGVPVPSIPPLNSLYLEFHPGAPR